MSVALTVAAVVLALAGGAVAIFGHDAPGGVLLLAAAGLCLAVGTALA